jgi:Tfp pilus assembly protein PilF
MLTNPRTGFGLAVLLTLTAILPSHPALARTCSPVAGELISAQGLVEYRAGDTWQQAAQGESLCDRDALRTGANSRAAIRLVDDAVLRLDENTTLVLSDVAPEPEEPSLLQLVFGAIQSFSRRPQTLEVDTPYINATIEGTEFALRVTATESALTVVEGTVLAANQLGSVSVASGGSAVASEGTAPRSVVVARPRDAVTWGLYYPPALSLDAAAGSQSAALAEAARLARGNRADAAIALLRASDRSTNARVYEAALLLSVGRADEAGQVLDAVLRAEPGNGTALAQSAVIDIVQNNRADGLAKAERAVAAAPDAAAPYIALSLAQQSDFRLEAARDTLLRATEAVPESPLVWARLSEIWLALGYRGRSGEAAERALELQPDLERAHVMKGFAALTEYRTMAAKEAFGRALTLDQADPLPRLGLGLALIREGELETGRGELDAAVALDSNSSLLRSYLGKAYFEEDRSPLAADQFEIAKELDPQDPTPYLYDAIRLQTENRPGEALAAIQDSIARNDNRAVYRGRLQLDQDAAARGASLGRVYDDLGFTQLGLREAARSQDLDPSNAAAHRFMADVYRNERRREIARVSELTRALLLQDVNLNPVQPSMTETNLNLVSSGGPANAGFNEFTSLFASDGFRFTSSGVVGNHDTFGGEAAVALQAENVSVSVGGFEFSSDGFRENFDAEHSIYDLFMQWAVTPEFNLQAEVRHRDTELGDLALNFDPDIFQEFLRLTEDEDTARLGARFSPDPHNDTLFSLVWNDRDLSEFNNFGGGFTGVQATDGDGWQVEAQHIYQGDRFSVTIGGAYTDFDDVQSTVISLMGAPFLEFPEADIARKSWRGYVYGTAELPLPDALGDLALTVGASVDSYKEDNGSVGAKIDVDEFNPKVGLQWDVTDELTFRAAYFEVVKPPLATNRTIEPTQVAGFNQYYDDANGTASSRYGFGLDYQVTDKLFIGAEATWRELEVPYFFFENGAFRDLETDWDERTHRVYLYALPHPRIPVSVELVYDRFEADSSGLTDVSPIPTSVETFSVPVTVRYFDPSGFFAGVRGTYVDQEVDRDNPSFGEGNSSFFNLDAMVGYRFPNQRGSLSLEVQNLLDNDFEYQDDAFREFSNRGATGPFFPDFGIMGRLTVNF